MRLLAILSMSVLLGACVTAPVAPRTEHLFHDHLFRPPQQRVSSDDVFAVSDEMRRFLNADVSADLRAEGPQRVLVDALYGKGRLRLEYDSVATRNASQAFAAKSGNCLSLVIMTAAFAKELGLAVRYQSVFVDDTWSRSGDLYFSSGHVNVTLARDDAGLRLAHGGGDLVTIDFLSPEETRRQRARVIREETIVAMYMNNRAAESLARGQLDDAYWWAREAMRQDPRFLSAYNTLGVIYRRHGNLPEAERILEQVLEREPGNTYAMSNLALVLNLLGRVEEATLLARRLDQVQPYPPFHFFNLGVTAMRSGDFAAARDLFKQEVDRASYYHEFHFWLAMASLRLGQTDQAREHLAKALENSTTRTDHDLYAAKLERIRSHRPQ